MTHAEPDSGHALFEAGDASSGSTESVTLIERINSGAAERSHPDPMSEEPQLELPQPVIAAATLSILPIPLDQSAHPPSDGVETNERLPEPLEEANGSPDRTSEVPSHAVEAVSPANPPSPTEPLLAPIPMEQPPAPVMGEMPEASSKSPAPPSQSPSDSSATEFWRLATERPQEVMDRFQRLLSTAREKNDLPLVERAYCVMAFVYAIQGDEARAMERLGHARVAARRRGDATDLEQAEERVRMLLSGRVHSLRSKE